MLKVKVGEVYTESEFKKLGFVDTKHRYADLMIYSCSGHDYLIEKAGKNKLKVYLKIGKS